MKKYGIFNEKSGKENRVTQELGDKGNMDIIKIRIEMIRKNRIWMVDRSG